LSGHAVARAFCLHPAPAQEALQAKAPSVQRTGRDFIPEYENGPRGWNRRPPAGGDPKLTRELYLTGKAKRLPPDVARQAARKLEYVDLATRLDDLQVQPGNRLHAHGRERKGQHAISVNDQWRISFRFEDGDAHEVEITDYH